MRKGATLGISGKTMLRVEICCKTNTETKQCAMADVENDEMIKVNENDKI